ncbi:MAG: hypothetical protein JWP97_1497 [Labilithrix sp.]|nr:hypothetical protein [Labilithrix sp.]
MRLSSSLEPPSLCDGGVAALVTDGANAVCERFAGPLEIALCVVLVVLAAALWKLPARTREWALAGAILLSAPGYLALAVRRADSPPRAGATAARLEEIERRLEEDGRTHGCENDTSACEACQPIARFAHARRGVCDGVKPRRGLTIAAADAGLPSCGDDGLACAPP